MYIGKLGALDGKNIFYITYFYTVQVKTIYMSMCVYDAYIYHRDKCIYPSSMCHLFFRNTFDSIYFPPKK